VTQGNGCTQNTRRALQDRYNDSVSSAALTIIAKYGIYFLSYNECTLSNRQHDEHSHCRHVWHVYMFAVLNLAH
jgi:hypothetical protein